ncbi:MAG TPA: chain-length determining protein [Planctomycetaceae bacterium]|nr:chain-length determining protein [Planctomycetaceae bacterium]
MNREITSTGTDRQFNLNDQELSIDILQVLSRQRWLIVFCSLMGMAAGVLYSIQSTVWYRSTAAILVNSKNAGLESNATNVVEEDILANHMQMLRSRKIVEGALTKDGLMDLASIQPLLTPAKGEDAADYVISQLEIVKGGAGAAKSARSLSLAFAHTDPEESRKILESVLVEYQNYIAGQLESVMSKANEYITHAKDEVESELRNAEQDYLTARKAAPMLFQGEGSSNVYQDKYRRVEEELLNVDIEESSLKTRLERVRETLGDMDLDGPLSEHLDKLALIDSESMQRLGLYASLQVNAASTADFQATQPARIAEAQTQYNNVLQLMSEKQRLTTVFGPSHPKVKDIQDQIDLVKNFLDEKKDGTSVGAGAGMLSPEALLKAYVGFLEHDLATLTQRKRELTILAGNAESQAKTLIDYELQDMVLRKKIERQEKLFDGVVQQLRELDTASGLSGYVYELLETPRPGIRSWPKLSICALGGLMLGLFGGLFLSIANDLRDSRFHSAVEFEQFIGLRTLGRIGKVNSMRQGVKGLIATELTPDAEAIRMMRTLLLMDVKSKKLQTIAMTSPMQGDGKSTVISNLAVSFSQLGMSVLVMDCDLRRPSIHNFFSVKRENGLVDVLADELEPMEAIRDTDVENVHVLPAGAPTSTPAELLQSPRFDQLLEILKEKYDVVLLDLPPVLAVSDPLVVAPKVSGVVVVFRAVTARKSEVANTLRRLSSAGAVTVGSVLNTLGAQKEFSSDGGYYGYYRSGYSEVSVPQRSLQNGAIPSYNGRVGSVITTRASDIGSRD